MKQQVVKPNGFGRGVTTCLAALLVALASLSLTSAASAKEVVAAFGEEGTQGGQFGAFGSTQSGYMETNATGTGPAEAGDLYVVDTANKRIQRFALDDKGTPTDPYDDTYEFVSAWGADVDATPGGGSDYEICTVAEECKAGVASGGNGSAAGNGALGGNAFGGPGGIAIDQDTGDVFVVDRQNSRINVYAGDGAFLRSFGFDVVASGPGDTGSGYEVCVAAAGDVCKEGTFGSGVGQFGRHPSGTPSASGLAISPADGNPISGTVFATDSENSRINTYDLDGANPSFFGSEAQIPKSNKPITIAVDSRGIVYFDVSKAGQPILRYDSENANGEGVGFLEPIQSETIAVTGGVGDATASAPYNLTFQGALSDTDVSQISVSNGTTPLSGGSGATVTTIAPGGPGVDEVQQLKVSATAGQFRLTFDGQTTTDLPFNAGAALIRDALHELSSVPDPAISPKSSNGTTGLRVDPDSDGPGPDEDVLYAMRSLGEPLRTWIYQFGPLNDPGLADAPHAADDIHGSAIGFTYAGGFGIDRAGGRLFVTSSFDTENGPKGTYVYVLDEASGVPASASIDSITDITAASATVNGTVNPNGPPPVSYRLEYSLDGTNWTISPGSETLLGTQTTPQPVSMVLNPPGTGLSPSTEYHVRIRALKAFTPPALSSVQTFTTLAASPAVETVGSPIRGANTATLEGRVDPRGTATTYHFEYGTQGPCSANPCESTSPQAVGADSQIRLVSQPISGLSPSTTYHYRLIADSGVGSPSVGGDMTVTTRASDAPLSHGNFPGPPGSDRAWEQVNLPDTGSNPITQGSGFSDDGERAIYQNSGGSPSSDTGTTFNILSAQRTPSGWISKQITPTRDQLSGESWMNPVATDDLSQIFTANYELSTLTGAFWRLQSGGSPSLIHAFPPGHMDGGFFTMSEDGSREVGVVMGNVDPNHPAPANSRQIYDVSSGTPHMASLLPGDVVPPCNTNPGENGAAPSARWLSPDGSLLAFPTQGGSTCDLNGPLNLYLRDLEAGETINLSAPAISGPHCSAELGKQTPGAVFFVTPSRLSAEDVAAGNCSKGGDVYRYDIGEGSLECVTCLVPGLSADVTQAAVAGDGSPVYFQSPNRLLPGAAAPALYRVDVASGELAYVAATGDDKVNGSINETSSGLTGDGSVLIFVSSAPGLNSVNGSQNGGTQQFYRYDDEDRSLVCVSCPPDGSVPSAPVDRALTGGSLSGGGIGPNTDPLDDAGDTFIFATPNALVSKDQNTAGAGQDPVTGSDVYEWRDGRILLITDGLTNWAGEVVRPIPNGVTPDGRNVFFTAAAQYTPDAIDAYTRLYTARIGGGIEFPPPPKPCPLEVCQGIPKGAPEEPAPGTGAFVGPGNAVAGTPKPRRGCPKGKRKVRSGGKARCVKQRKGAAKKAGKANNNRRNHR